MSCLARPKVHHDHTLFLLCTSFASCHENQGKLPALADNDEVLGFIEKMGVDELAIAGGFNPADIVTAF